MGLYNHFATDVAFVARRQNDQAVFSVLYKSINRLISERVEGDGLAHLLNVKHHRWLTDSKLEAYLGRPLHKLGDGIINGRLLIAYAESVLHAQHEAADEAVGEAGALDLSPVLLVGLAKDVEDGSF